MIDFVLEKNIEHNSLCYIKKDDTKIYLTEKELNQLLEKVYANRDDIFEDFAPIYAARMEVEDMKEQISDLESQIEDYDDKVDYLEDLLDDENIDYDD